MNALIQFILHIPSLKLMFDFTPKSFLPFNIFIDSYDHDRAFQKNYSSINSEILFECLYKKFPEKHFIKNKSRIDLFKILNLIMGSFFEDENMLHFQKNINLLAFHPQWQIVLDSKQTLSFETYIEDMVDNSHYMPKELLISYKWFSNGKKIAFKKNLKAKKNIFLKKDIYQLDAFIEFRADNNSFGSYITYLNVNNIWYQFYEAKRKKIKTDHLYLALKKSILLHYKIVKSNFIKLI